MITVSQLTTRTLALSVSCTLSHSPFLSQSHTHTHLHKHRQATLSNFILLPSLFFIIWIKCTNLATTFFIITVYHFFSFPSVGRPLMINKDREIVMGITKISLPFDSPLYSAAIFLCQGVNNFPFLISSPAQACPCCCWDTVQAGL